MDGFTNIFSPLALGAMVFAGYLTKVQYSTLITVYVFFDMLKHTNIYLVKYIAK